MEKLTFNLKYFVIAGLIGLLSDPATAAVPHTFAGGGIIKSSEMNDNFTAHDADIGALNTRITALEAHTADTTNPHAVTKSQIGLANVEDIRVNFTATTAPSVNDDSNSGYSVGSVWINTTTRQAYVLLDAASGTAVWKEVVRTYSIGSTGPAGGIVFYVTDGGLHGLEAASTDQSTTWGCTGTDITAAAGTAIGTGAANTAAIVAACADADTAAKLADAYVLNGYTDWFLPSKDELNLLYAQKDIVGGFASNVYWSSSQDNNFTAWFQYFSNGIQNGFNKRGTFRVRAVRAF